MPSRRTNASAPASRQRQQPSASPSGGPQVPPDSPQVVDPRWILGALGGTIALAVVLAWITICVLFSRGQWQIVLHPSHTVAQTPAAVDLPFSPVRFAPDASGQPQLSGWWIPSDSAADPTALVLHSADGSLADTLPDLRALHDARLNILAFDPHGYGASAGPHPTQASLQQDAESALEYLATRGIPARSTVLVGSGIGASLAATLCAHHPEVPALILLAPDGDLAPRARLDPRARMVPFGLLFHEDFPLAKPLSTLHTPKLLVQYAGSAHPFDPHTIADPKFTVTLNSPSNAAALHEALRRFLDDTFPGH